MPVATNAGSKTRDEFIHHSRMGRVSNWWVDDKKPGAGWHILTDESLVCNILPGKMFFIAGMIWSLNTRSDHCKYCLGFTDRPDGAGDFVAVIHCLDITTGGKTAGNRSYHEPFRLPVCLRYSNGCRSVTWRVKAEDNKTQIMVGFYGWTEDEE